MRLSLFAALALGTASLLAHADTTATYTYTGEPFASATPPLTTNDFLRGSFTTSTPFTPNADIYVNTTYTSTLSSFAFTDGVHSFNQSNSLFLGYFYVDATGAITNWDFLVFGDVNGFDDGFLMQSQPDGFTPYDDVDSTIQGFSVTYLPGSFTTGTTPVASSPMSATPEPSSLILLATGILGSYGLLRRTVTLR